MSINRMFIVSIVLSSFLVAGGLKLIGVDKKGVFPLNSYDLTGIKSIQAYINGSLKAFDPALPQDLWGTVQPFTSFESGRGYWIVLNDSSSESQVNFDFSGDEITLNDIKIEDNSNLSLVSFPANMAMSEIIDFFTNKNCNVKSIQAYINGSLKAFDPALPQDLWGTVQPFTSTQEGLGYWVVFDGVCTISSQSSSESSSESSSQSSSESSVEPAPEPEASSDSGLELPPSPPSF